MKKPIEESGGERLHKLIARAGIASRRGAEEIVTQGRVMVNGIIVKELGAKADPMADRISVDGQPLRLSATSTVVLLHKPAGVVSTKKDPEGRTTVSHLMPEKFKHLHPIGRLDFDTSGVIFLTDDGDLTHLLTHPSHGVDKVYHARVGGIVTVDTMKKLENGIFLEDGKTSPCRARVRAQTEKNALVQLTLREGRNRQVRRMLDAVGHPVKALRRVKMAGFGLDGLLSGEHRVLIDAEVHMLRKAADTKTKLRIKAPVRTKAKAALSAQSAAEGSEEKRAAESETSKPKIAEMKVARVAKPTTQNRAASASKTFAKPTTRSGSSSPTPPTEAPIKARRSPQAMPTRTSVALRNAPKTARPAAEENANENRFAPRTAASRANEERRKANRTSTREDTRDTPKRDTPSRDTPKRNTPERSKTSRAPRDNSHPLAQRVEQRFAGKAFDNAPRRTSEARQNAFFDDDAPAVNKAPKSASAKSASAQTSSTRASSNATNFSTEAAKSSTRFSDKSAAKKPAKPKSSAKISPAKAAKQAAQADKYASKARRGARAWGGKTRKRA